MSRTATTFTHVRYLGQLVANLHSLELVLRLFLLDLDGGGAVGDYLRIDRPGQDLPENPLTNYDSLGTLIRKYNRLVAEHDPTLTVDSDIAALRDALFHGRVAALNPTGPWKLLKFGRPKDGLARVTHCADMNLGWFCQNVDHVFIAIGKVIAAAKLLQLPNLCRTGWHEHTDSGIDRTLP